MNFQTDLPTAPPPSQKRIYPWQQRVNYKSGKVAQAFALQARPEDVKAGFSYYDNDIKENVAMPTFRAVVVASLSGVAGVTKDGDHYSNWFSNLVKDTRDDIIEVRCQGIDKPQYTGIYADIKPELPQGVSYTQVLICYIPEHDCCMSINLTVGLQNHLRTAIAKATNTPVKKINLFSLCDLTSQYWGFQFTGEFEKIDKEGYSWKGQGEMYFMPECTVFTINQKPGTEAQFDLLNAAHEACEAYVKAEQDRIYGAKPVHVVAEMPTVERAANTIQPPSNAHSVPFPTMDVTDYDAAPGDIDQLPF